MFLVLPQASDDELLALARNWIDLLADEEYETVFANLGYAVRFDKGGAESIRNAIKTYRSGVFFPGENDFVVTDWRTATGGNPSPHISIRRFEPNDLAIRCTIEMDLPLNGKWSDLEIDFVMFERDSGNVWALTLEDIVCTRQLQEEFEHAFTTGE